MLEEQDQYWEREELDPEITYLTVVESVKVSHTFFAKSKEDGIRICCCIQEINENTFTGYVYNMSMNGIVAELEEEDLDILKLKCLIKAKEFGWKINKII